MQTLTLVEQTAVNVVIAETHSVTTMKQEQEFVQTEFLRGKDVFAVLLSSCSLVMRQMCPGTNMIFTIVWPLVALIEDQIQEPSQLVITAMQTDSRDAASWYSAVTQGECSITAQPTEVVFSNWKSRRMRSETEMLSSLHLDG